MDTGLYCPACRDQFLHLAPVDHQHLVCPNCGVFLCAICPQALARNLAEHERQARRRRVAALN